MPPASSSGCSETVRTGQASSYLVLQRLEGASGAESGAPFQSVLRSDVQTKGSIFEDNGRVDAVDCHEGRHQSDGAVGEQR